METRPSGDHLAEQAPELPNYSSELSEAKIQELLKKTVALQKQGREIVLMAANVKVAEPAPLIRRQGVTGKSGGTLAPGAETMIAGGAVLSYMADGFVAALDIVAPITDGTSWRIFVDQQAAAIDS